MHQKQIRGDQVSKKTPDYLTEQQRHGEITSGVFLILFFSASIISIIVSALIK